MAKDLNKVMLIGRLGKDVDLRVTPSGNSVATFSVASSRNVKDGDNWKEQTEWFRVVAWEKLAETAAKYLNKGQRVYIEGRLQTREWQDNSGQKRYTTEVIANDLILLDNKRDQPHEDEDPFSAPAPAKSSAGNSRSNGKPAAAFDDDLEPEDIPF